MIRVIGIAIFALLVATLIYWAVLAALFLLSAGAGVVGLICVKLKRPLAVPYGHVLVPICYSILWATAIALALFIGSRFINLFMPRVVDDALAWLQRDMLLFFVEASIVLLLAGRAAQWSWSASSVWLAGVFTYLAASIVLSISPPSPSGSVPDFAATALAELWSTLLFPYTVVATFQQGGTDALYNHARDWLAATDGNLFKLSTVLSKVFWIAALLYLIAGWLLPRKAAPAVVHRPLTPEERSTFRSALLAGAAVFAVLGWIAWGGYRISWTQWTLLFAANVVLMWVLYQSRKT